MIATPLLAAVAALAPADDPRPHVASHERFHRDGAESAEGGLLLLGELGCTACHADDAGVVARKPAPALDGVARRLDPTWIRDYLLDPAGTLPGTTMPDALAAVDAAARDAIAEDLVHFLVSLDPDAFRRSAPDLGAAVRGEELFHQRGCVACHGPRAVESPPEDPSLKSLGRLEPKWSVDGLAAFLDDPLAVRAGARMPDLGLDGRQARDVAHYLLLKTRVPGPLAFEVRHGRFERFSDIPLVAPVRTGVTAVVGEELAGRRNDWAIVVHGYVTLDAPEEVTFHVETDRRARLLVDGSVVAEARAPDDQSRPAAWADGRVELARGTHALRLEAFRRFGKRDPALALEWTRADGTRGPLPPALLHHEREPVAPAPPFAVDPERAARGRAHFDRLGCASCHGSADGADGGASGPAAPALSALGAGRGCLAPDSSGPHPRHALDGEQRADVRAALALLADDPAPPPAATRVDRRLERLGCLACHARGGRGGPVEEAATWFSSTADEPADEARLPPRLDGVGDKLRPAWLERVLRDGERVRPSLRARMPRYPREELGTLAADLVALDRDASSFPEVPDGDDALREAGRALTGNEGLGCIVCHVFHDHRAESVQAPDLVHVTGRLQPDWFHRFLLDPEGLKPGTRMTASWPDGVSAAPEILDGDADRQIAALWTYLADGERAIHPKGLSRRELELIVGGEAVVYRGKLWEAGFRGIAVGFPERVHAAYDAEELRLALLWRGRFLNVAAHWTRQGMGRPRPLGRDVRVMPRGPDVAILAAPDAPWPAGGERPDGHRFRGYDLDGLRRPTFRYDVGPVRVTDAPRAVEEDGRTFLRRTLRFASEAAIPGLAVRVARAAEIAEPEPGRWRAGDVELVVRGAPASVRDAGEERELLVDLSGHGRRGELVVEYRWGGER